ncbi:replication protein A 70 kDa DNA-binding subunit B-like [Prosopis cineraria]|uniref:replication protein A 70 kDa DNA-binding subunit B-like n=1 Tax=Prosopis cineraria TaxID=364024 RepID=UPI00240F03A6|nr:replication protein A 70 kDa DNA-binding subunit B-like [Prosopis cineraria]
MATEDYELVKTIDDTKEASSLIVRVIRKWCQLYKSPPHHLACIMFVFIDEEGNKIHAEVTNKQLHEQYKREPSEGDIIYIENFTISPNTWPYRPTSHPWRLQFHPNTYIRPHDAELPRNSFNFVCFTKLHEDMKKKELNTEVLIDVIGFLKSFGDLIDSRTDNAAQNRLSYTLADEEDVTVNCLLWGETATQTYWAKQDDMDPPIIVLMQFARISVKNGILQLSNSYTATRITFNPDIPEAKDLLERLQQSTNTSSLSFTQTIQCETSQNSSLSLLQFPDRFPISHIAHIDEEKEFLIKGTIKKLQTGNGWTYDGCDICTSKPMEQNNKQFCNIYFESTTPSLMPLDIYQLSSLIDMLWNYSTTATVLKNELIEVDLIHITIFVL